MPFTEAQAKVAEIIRDRVLVGHAVQNDLIALMLKHPPLLVRDTSKYKPFKDLAGGRTPGLKKLVKEVLGIEIQEGSHSSVRPTETNSEDKQKLMIWFVVPAGGRCTVHNDALSQSQAGMGERTRCSRWIEAQNAYATSRRTREENPATTGATAARRRKAIKTRTKSEGEEIEQLL